MSKFRMIPYIDVSDLSREAQDWCCNHDIDIHQNNGVLCVDEFDGDNPVCDSLRNLGVPEDSEGEWVVALRV